MFCPLLPYNLKGTLVLGIQTFVIQIHRVNDRIERVSIAGFSINWKTFLLL